MNQYENLRVFITGAASGIGKEILNTFLANKCKVAFCDINDEAAQKILEEKKADKNNLLYFKVDVRKPEEIHKCMESIFLKWGDIDVLINNVGISEFKNILEVEVEDFDNVINTNLRSVFVTSRYLARHRANLKEKNLYGRIINISSTRYLQSESGTEGYAASKGGIVSLTHSLSISLSDLNITVNCISPGWIQNTDYESLTQEDHYQHPSRRVGKPSDIASMCLYIAHPNNDFLNGENIVIDGGMTKKMIYVE